MLTLSILVIFVLGYLAIIFEHKIGVNKTTSALLTAGILWALVFQSPEISQFHHYRFLQEELSGVIQIVLFLIGALAIVEVINAHKGFSHVAALLNIRSKRKLLWVVGFITFFLSAILDNLTTTIVMVSLIKKVIPEKEDRWTIGSAIVIAANAGGAWTPIGDVTTTMLWIGGQLTSWNIITSLFLPSLACLVLALIPLQFFLKGEVTHQLTKQKTEPHGLLVLILGVSALVFVPIFKSITGLPPFMGILFGLAIIWMVTDFLHQGHPERGHLRVSGIMKRVDLPSVVFFLGILLAVGALHEVGILEELANFLDQTLKSPVLIATVIGILSAIVDNVPLVAASMGMYNLSEFPTDSSFWELIAYTAGTGGSMLIIGSAAGVVFMGIEKTDFFFYLKRVTLSAAIGYFGGIGVYLLQQSFF